MTTFPDVYLPSGTLLHSIDASGNQRHFYHCDELGSTVFLTDDSASITDSYSSAPYGEDFRSTGSTPNPFTFLGRHGVVREADTGRYLMGFRYFDSVTARFLTRDPVPRIEPRAVNPYEYAVSSPLSSTNLGMCTPRSRT